ncbi:MAG: DMT family transporter [Spirochaetota bacterium]
MEEQLEFRNLSSKLLLIATAVLWSSGGVLIKYISWHPLAIAGMRSAFASIIIFLVIRKPRFNISFNQIGGGISYAATVIFFVSATKLTTAANAILLQYTAPVYTAIFSRSFLNEKTAWYDWVVIIVVLSGMALFFLDKLNFGGYMGNILALASGVSVAWLGLFLRKQRDASSIESVLLGNIITAIIGFPFMLSGFPEPLEFYGLVALGLFQLGLPFILYTIALKKVRALDAMLIIIIEPILNPLWVFIFLGETPGRWAFIGGCIVLISLFSRTLFVHGLRIKR